MRGRAVAPYLSVGRTFATSRRLSQVLALLVVVCGLVAIGGQRELALPSADGGGTPIQYWRLLAAAAATLALLVLRSPFHLLESAAGPSFARIRAMSLGLAIGVSACCYLVATAVGSDAAVAPTVRALCAWYGLALISSRLLGPTSGWIFPWIALVCLVYWGFDGTQRTYRWWEFSAQPIDHLPSLTLSAALFIVGLCCYGASPWRLRALRWAIRDKLSAPGSTNAALLPSPHSTRRRGLIVPGTSGARARKRSRTTSPG